MKISEIFGHRLINREFTLSRDCLLLTVLYAISNSHIDSVDV